MRLAVSCDFLTAQAVDVELPYGISFFIEFGFELQSELATDETVVSAALCTGRYSRVKNFLQFHLRTSS